MDRSHGKAKGCLTHGTNFSTFRLCTNGSSSWSIRASYSLVWPVLLPGDLLPACLPARPWVSPGVLHHELLTEKIQIFVPYKWQPRPSSHNGGALLLLPMSLLTWFKLQRYFLTIRANTGPDSFDRIFWSSEEQGGVPLRSVKGKNSGRRRQHAVFSLRAAFGAVEER